MEGIKFKRFKKKSLILLHEVLDGRLLKKSKNMKILQTLQTYHLKQGIFEEKTLKGHSDWVKLLVKINGNTIASASMDKSIKIWDIITGKCLKTLEGHSNCVSLLVKINEDTIASASYYIPYFYTSYTTTSEGVFIYNNWKISQKFGWTFRWGRLLS